MYKVLVDFTDLRDENRIYKKGDTYPAKGVAMPSAGRLGNLISGENQRGRPLIEKVEQKADTAPVNETPITEPPAPPETEQTAAPVEAVEQIPETATEESPKEPETKGKAKKPTKAGK